MSMDTQRYMMPGVANYLATVASGTLAGTTMTSILSNPTFLSLVLSTAGGLLSAGAQYLIAKWRADARAIEEKLGKKP